MDWYVVLDDATRAEPTLVLSERAVEKHINSIFSKLHLSEERDVNRRVAAVLVYLTDGDAGHTLGEVAARFPGPR